LSHFPQFGSYLHKSYASAFELLADYASQDPYKALPRNIINAINECAIQAWDEEKSLADDEIVNDVAPLVFA
jgi:hypothetical protein